MTEKPQPDPIAREARRLAESEGKDWRSLTKEERREFKVRVRQSQRQ
jgi:hypothetical protein